MNQGNRTNMAKSFPPSSLGRDFMSIGSGSKFSQQGSCNLLSGPSSKNLPPIFSIGNRAPPPLPSQHRGDPNQASKILASFGLSSRDLDELSRYPEENITPENLPQLIQQIKRRRSEDMSMLSYRERLPREPLRVSSSDWDDDVRQFRRESFVERSPGLDHVVDYDHGSRAQEPAYRERLDLDDRLRDRERYREDSFQSDTSFRKLGTDYEPMGYSQPQERSAFEKATGMPSIRNIEDFHGLSPKDFPDLCSLCDIPVHTKGWSEHINGPTHKRHRLQLLDGHPDWKGHGMGDSAMLRQSTNHAPELLGPPPPPPPPPQSLSMGGGPEGRRGNQRVDLGMEDRGPGLGFGPGLGPRRMQSRPRRTVKVVHIINVVRGRNLKNQLLKLAEPFGRISNIIISNKMKEAFIEMSNAEDTQAVVDYYSINQAIVMGKPVRVQMSQKFKRVKKPAVKPEARPEPKKQEVGRVVRLSKLPTYGYTDSALLNLAESFGKVKTYILMRNGNRAFIEMERVEDAQDMVKRCEIVPLVFHGKTLKVDLSERHKKLILRIPNKLIEQRKKNRLDWAMLRQSTNHAPELLGPPPPPQSLSMGSGPKGRRGNQRVHVGMEDRGPGFGPGPRRMQSRPRRIGKVVHIINFVRGRNLKNHLLKLAEPFGRIFNIFISNKMKEAFIEMSNAEDALAVVDYYSINQAIVMGKPVRVQMSQKYKSIKKPAAKLEARPEPKKQDVGRVVYLTKLPLYSTYSALFNLAESFGKVKTCILMRKSNRAFIEMERAEDAQDMVKRCKIVPLVFQGKILKVDLSDRHENLVLKIPKKHIEQKENNQKRAHSPDRKVGVKEKQKKMETDEITEDGDGECQTTSDEVMADDTIHTSEETDIVTDSCEPELVEEEEEEEASAPRNQ